MKKLIQALEFHHGKIVEYLQNLEETKKDGHKVLYLKLNLLSFLRIIKYDFGDKDDISLEFMQPMETEKF